MSTLAIADSSRGLDDWDGQSRTLVLPRGPDKPLPRAWLSPTDILVEGEMTIGNGDSDGRGPA